MSKGDADIVDFRFTPTIIQQLTLGTARAFISAVVASLQQPLLADGMSSRYFRAGNRGDVRRKIRPTHSRRLGDALRLYGRPCEGPQCEAAGNLTFQFESGGFS